MQTQGLQVRLLPLETNLRKIAMQSRIFFLGLPFPSLFLAFLTDLSDRFKVGNAMLIFKVLKADRFSNFKSSSSSQKNSGQSQSKKKARKKLRITILSLFFAFLADTSYQKSNFKRHFSCAQNHVISFHMNFGFLFIGELYQYFDFKSIKDSHLVGNV